MAAPQQQKKKLGELLVQSGIIDELQLRSALAHQSQWGGRLGNVLLKLNLISEQKLVAFLARQYRMPVMDLSRIKIMPETLAMIPKALALKTNIMPLFTAEENKKDILCIAMTNPGDLMALDEIHFASRHEARPVIVSDPQLTRALGYYYEGKGISPADSDAKPSTQFTFSDLVQITKEYLNAHRVAEMKKGPQGDARRDSVIGTSTLSFDSSKPKASAPANAPNDETVLVFTSSGETQLSIDDSPEPAAPIAATPAVAASDNATDLNTERILKALIATLEEKGLISKADIRKHLKALS